MQSRRHAAPSEWSYTWSMVGASFMFGVVAMLVFEESTRATPQPQKCAQTLEVVSLLRRLDQMQHYDRLMRAGYDRADILSQSRYLDFNKTVGGIRPYHWARIKAEALRMTGHPQTSVARQLEDEPLVDGAAGAVDLEAGLEEAKDDLFINIGYDAYVPDAPKGHGVVTVVCTGPLHERLHGLLSAAVLAKSTHSSLHVLWVEDAACGARFPYLLSANDKVSVSILKKGTRRTAAGVLQEHLSRFDACFSSGTGPVAETIADLPTQSYKPSDAASAVWRHNKAASLAVDSTSDVASWLLDRISSEERAHVLYESSVFPAGMVATSAKEAVRMFGLRLSTDVAETAKRLVSNNDLDGERTAAVYEADVPTLDLQTDVVGKYTKLLLLRSPGMHAAAAFPESLQVIKSIHNPDAAVDISPADLLATCSVLSSLRMRILPNPPPTESTPSNRLEAVLTPVLCDAGLTC